MTAYSAHVEAVSGGREVIVACHGADRWVMTGGQATDLGHDLLACAHQVVAQSTRDLLAALDEQQHNDDGGTR